MRRTRLVISLILGIALSVGLLVVIRMNQSAVAASVDASITLPSEADGGAPDSQQVTNTAYIAVRFADNDVAVRAITFTKPISALRALELSGFAFTTADFGWGLFLCSIEDVGDSGDACDNDDRYWATYYWDGGSWAGRMVGITEAMITQTGHLEAFSWSDPGWDPVDPPPASPLTAAWQALVWLQAQQEPDGGYGTPGSTAEVLMALGANRMAADSAARANTMSRGAGLAGSDAAGAGKLGVALTAHDICWPRQAPMPLDYYSPTTGAFDVDAAPHAWAMLGTAALSETVPPSATQYLMSLQQPSGGWEWGQGWGVDTNSTALAIQALVAAGEPLTSTSIVSALTYLQLAQNADGGFPYDPTSAWDTESDTNSTAYVVQALLAAGQDPLTVPWTINDTHPMGYLLAMQLEDGSFEWQPGLGPNQAATQQVIPALLHRPFPVRIVALDVCSGAYLPLVSRGE